jgi:formate dehydrogenase assembly factor FdhD
MGSPQDLDDFAVGFAITDGVVRSNADIQAIDARIGPEDARINLVLSPEAFRWFLASRRHRSLR